MPLVSRSEVVLSPRVRVSLVIIVSVLVGIGYITGTMLGLSAITPLLFYFPIILAAYWFPRQGVIFAVGIGIAEVFFVYLYHYPSLPDITFAVTTASFYVLVAIAVVISSLSSGLNEREARYRGIFSSSEAAIFLVGNGDSEMRIEEANPGGGTLLGCHPADLKGQSLAIFWRDSPARQNLFESLKKNGTVSQMESTMTRENGASVPVLISGSLLPGRMMVLTMIDISARKAHEQEMEARNQQLSIINRVIAQASGAKGVEDMGRGVLANLTGYMGCEFGGITLFGEGASRNLTEIHHGDASLFQSLMESADESAATWKEAISGGKFLVWNRGSSPQCRSPETGIVVPLQSGDDTIGAMYFLSCSGRACSKDQQQTLESLSREIATTVTRLLLSQRVAETNQQANLYLDILMHDINNANLASLWYGDLLQDMLSGESREIAGKMIEGIKKSRDIIRNLETIRKIQVRKNELKAVSLDDAIRKEIRLFPEAHIEFQESGARVLGDDLIGEIFNNLLGNSLKFGGRGVKIFISPEMPDPETVLVWVSDTGPGIPDDLKSVIFRRFSHADRQNAGKGLGLYIVKTLLERYGGTISVTDRVAGDHTQGVSFRMTFRKAP
ncbi:MAG: sensor protein KdpD [Methanoregulaceae archaeon PtaB.Bin056]|jgi:PAS domain S-box-containing protein|nr:MAG: sensor protein KdpD [Methanoregulaceae archaeon PtaB.Bin056]